jgi:hypothetical protein
MRTTRRLLGAAALLLGLMTVASLPAYAQVETLYAGVTPPAISAGQAPGAVLANSGERALPTQVAPIPSVAATAGARQGLAFTGADIVGLVTLGLSFTLVGAVLTRRARARISPQG